MVVFVSLFLEIILDLLKHMLFNQLPIMLTSSITMVHYQNEENNISTISWTKPQTLSGFHQFFHYWSFFVPGFNSVPTFSFSYYVPLDSSNQFLFLSLSLSLMTLTLWKCFSRYFVHCASVCFSWCFLVIEKLAND